MEKQNLIQIFLDLYNEIIADEKEKVVKK